MKAAFRIAEADYVRAMKLYAKPTWRLIAPISAILLMVIAVIASAPSGDREFLIFCLVALVIWIVVVYGVVSPVRARFHYRRYKAMHDEFTVELVEDGVRYTSPNGEATVPWNNILKWRQNENYILIYLSPRLFHIVPKSIVADGFDIPALINQLTRHVGNPV